MKRFLKKLPHIRRRDDTSDRRPSIQPSPIETVTPCTPTVFYDADDNNTTERTKFASNGQPKSAQSKDETRLNRNSTSSALKNRGSALVSYDQPVDNPSTSIQISDTSRPNTKKSYHGLELGPQDTSLYDDLSYLTLGGDSRDASDPSRKRYSEDVADPNLMANAKGSLPENPPARRGSVLVQPPTQVDEFSEDIEDRNLSTSYPASTQDQMNRRVATQPYCSDEFYEPRFGQDSESGSPSG
jgi:hypothetical protein